MKRLWFLLAQAVTVAVFFFLLVVLIAPDMFPSRARIVVLGSGNQPPPVVRAARPDVGVAAYAFPLSAVRLLPGSPFTENEARIHAFLDSRLVP